MSAGFIPTPEPMLNKHTVGKGAVKLDDFHIRSIYSNLETKIRVEKDAEYFEKTSLKDRDEQKTDQSQRSSKSRIQAQSPL